MNENFIESLVVMVIGIGVVFSSLLVFYFVILGLRKLDEIYNKYRVSKTLNNPIEIVNTKETEGQAKIDPKIAAVISAVIYEIYHKPIRVKNIKFLNDTGSNSWISSGRNTIMSSHTINKR